MGNENMPWRIMRNKNILWRMMGNRNMLRNDRDDGSIHETEIG